MIKNKQFKRSATWTAVLDLLGNGVRVVTLNGEGGHRSTLMNTGSTITTVNAAVRPFKGNYVMAISKPEPEHWHTLPDGENIIVS